ncbi:MAG: hypothetical protein K2N74_02225, partial [Clostridiales bacterium]|nr:hypothetical protein [Clostridiales bacterium]
IAQVLKAIASSEEISRLFDAVTKQFDYLSAKRSYLRFPAAAGSSHGAAFLPADRGDIIAFIFCLLVEFDSSTAFLGDFLLRYFYEDGSYTASFTIFTERMIVPFRDIVKSCFPDALNRTVVGAMEEKEDNVLRSVAEWTEYEAARIGKLNLSVREQVAAETILSQVKATVGRKEVAAVKALVCGYRYFVLCNGIADEAGNAIFSFVESL